MSSKAKQSQKLLLFRLFGSRLFGIGTLPENPGNSPVSAANQATP